MAPKQIDCFNINLAYLKVLGLWPGDNTSRCYKYFSRIFILFFLLAYIIILCANFFFLPRQLDVIVEEMIFYFTEVAIATKVLTFYLMRDDIKFILNTLECDTFQPNTEDGLKIVENAKRFIVTYWKIAAVISHIANLSHVLSPLFAHLFSPIGLALPISSYSFIPEDVKEKFIYPLYIYQSVGMHFHMLYNVNIDGFFLGLIVLTIAQLEVLDYNLRRVTDYGKNANREEIQNMTEREHVLKFELIKCFIQYDKIYKFIILVQNVFSLSMFVLVTMSSCIVCVCLFRFTLPAPTPYYVFLTTYMAAMVLQILVPCWFGSRVMETSSKLLVAVYNCDWTARPREFKINMRLFAERMKKPLSLTALNMFPLSLTTFTSIMNSAYSFFTLLRHMQTRDA